MRSRTPFAAIAERRAKSVCLPSTGVWSNFQSPEWTMVPCAVSMVMPTASGML